MIVSVITRARVPHSRYWHSSDVKPEGLTELRANIEFYVDCSKCSLRKPVFCAAIFVDYTVKYRSEIKKKLPSNKSRPRLVATPKQG